MPCVVDGRGQGEPGSSTQVACGNGGGLTLVPLSVVNSCASACPSFAARVCAAGSACSGAGGTHPNPRCAYPMAQNGGLGPHAPALAAEGCRYPVGSGVVRSWDDLAGVWRRTWSDLGVDPSDCGALLTDAPAASTAGRVGMLELALETFGFRRAAVQVACVGCCCWGRGGGVKGRRGGTSGRPPEERTR